MKSYVCVDGTYLNTGIGKTEKEAIDTVLQALDTLQKEKQKLIKMMVFGTLPKYTIIKKIEELKAVKEISYGRIKYQEGKVAGLEELLKGE